jgi:sporulation-control protein spo0M
MGFSDKMRDSLGAEGAKIEVDAQGAAVAPGDIAAVTVVIVGGTKPAAVDALVVRLVEAERHWVDKDGKSHAEQSVAADDRSGLTAGWTRSTVAELRVEVGVTVEPGARHSVDVSLTVPEAARASTPACTHTISVQADIKGQIDPTGNARLSIG